MVKLDTDSTDFLRISADKAFIILILIRVNPCKSDLIRGLNQT